jgi:hypothetical protein
MVPIAPHFHHARDAVCKSHHTHRLALLPPPTGVVFLLVLVYSGSLCLSNHLWESLISYAAEPWQ